MQLTLAQQQFLLNTARCVIRGTLCGQAPLSPQVDDPLLHSPAGAFVSLHEVGTHRLRGCVGRLQASGPLVQTIMETAANVLSDPRFTHVRVTVAELTRLNIEISVLSPLQPTTHPLDFDPPNDGIYLTCCGRSGTFLPQVARQTGWTREQLLARLCLEKLGMPADAWQMADARLQKYTVTLIGPVPFVEAR